MYACLCVRKCVSVTDECGGFWCQQEIKERPSRGDRRGRLAGAASNENEVKVVYYVHGTGQAMSPHT